MSNSITDTLWCFQTVIFINNLFRTFDYPAKYCTPQINDLVNKNIDDTLQDTILSINQDLSIVSDTMRECYFNHPSRLTEFTRSDY